MHGRGKYIWPNLEQCYLGEWKHGKRHGQGRHHFSSTKADVARGEFYDGSWHEGTMHGRGVYVDAGGQRHEGTWNNGICPEVDFTHILESGSFRYCFVVRESPAGMIIILGMPRLRMHVIIIVNAVSE